MNSNDDSSAPKGGSKELGSRIRALREARRATDPSYTLRQFAKAVGVSPTYVSMIETGEMTASAEVLKKIAVLLGANVDELLSLADKFDPALNRVVAQPGVAAFLRTVDGMSSEELKKVQTIVDYVKNKSETDKPDV